MMISTCRSPFCALTPRQTELLELLSASPSATSRELAQRMHVSERTVKNISMAFTGPWGAKPRRVSGASISQGAW